jgi:hypothetical protein
MHSPSALTTSTTTAPSTHRKQPSFDRDWTMGSAYSSRRLSGTGLHDMMEGGGIGGELQDSAVDLDRGYFSGGELDSKKRSVLRKRGSGHGRKQSYADEQRARSGTSSMARQSRQSRHSRFGSLDLSLRELGRDLLLSTPSTAATSTAASPAAQRYYGVGPGAASSSSAAAPSSSSPALATHDLAAPPTVTRLDGVRSQSPHPDAAVSPATMSPSSSSRIMDFWPAKSGARTSGGGLRALSETVTGAANSKMVSTDSLAAAGNSGDPPSRSGSGTTPSHSLDFGSSSAGKSPSAINTAASSSAANVATSARPAVRKGKTKQETSAYLRGLQKVTPREAMADADYSGWMRKKSSNIMGTWKPRLFILKGRRLAYYYSEDDEQEKGLIDISFHRVLPADGERLTGLHATITGAGSASLPTISSATSPTDESPGADASDADSSIFIFKLVPPRAGLSRAVNFTKPTVHYFAVPNVSAGRLWMAALVKATIDRDDTQAVTTTYQQKTISLAKARQMQQRPPALAEAGAGEDVRGGNARRGLGISIGEADSGVSGLEGRMVTSPAETVSSARFYGEEVTTPRG